MKIKFIKPLVLSLFIFSSLSSCAQPGVMDLFFCQQPLTNPAISSEKLMSFPEDINIDGTKYILYPALGETDKYITITLYATSNNEITGSLPPNYKYENIWLVRKSEVWEIKNFSISQSSPNPSWVGNLCLENTYERDINSNSSLPSQTVLENIYVVARITDKQGKEYFIKSKEGQSLNTLILNWF